MARSRARHSAKPSPVSLRKMRASVRRLAPASSAQRSRSKSMLESSKQSAGDPQSAQVARHRHVKRRSCSRASSVSISRATMPPRSHLVVVDRLFQAAPGSAPAAGRKSPPAPAAAAAPRSRRRRYRSCASRSWLRMVTLCGHFGGSHSARAGGTIQAASRRLDPHDAADRMQQLPAAVHVQRDRVADREGARHDRDLARGVVHIAAVNRLWSFVTHGHDRDENRPNIAKWQGLCSDWQRDQSLERP